VERVATLVTLLEIASTPGASGSLN
jgi:hypothetical protein